MTLHTDQLIVNDVLPQWSRRQCYVDIYTLVSHGIDMPTGLAAAKAIDQTFDPIIRALQFYGDGTLCRVPAGMRRDLSRWAQMVDLSRLPTLRPRHGLCPAGPER